MIGIGAIRLLSLVCLLMWIIASILRYTGYLNFTVVKLEVFFSSDYR